MTGRKCFSWTSNIDSSYPVLCGEKVCCTKSPNNIRRASYSRVQGSRTDFTDPVFYTRWFAQVSKPFSFGSAFAKQSFELFVVAHLRQIVVCTNGLSVFQNGPPV